MSPSSFQGMSTPALVGDGAGTAWVGWMRFENNRLSWQVRRRQAAVWEPAVELLVRTTGPSEDVAPYLAYDATDGAVMMAWRTEGPPIQLFSNRYQGYAAAYDPVTDGWVYGHPFESEPGDVRKVALTARATGGFDLLWAQDDGSRSAMRAGGLP